MKDKRNIGCEELSRRYVAGEMTAREAKSFRAHLARCEACKQLASEWEELFAVLSAPISAPVFSEPSPEFDKPIMAFVRSMIKSRREALAGAGTEAPAPEWAAAQPGWARTQPAPARAVQPRQPAWAAALRSKLVWVSGISVAAVLVVLGLVIRGFTVTLPSGERQYVSAVVWVVDFLGRGLDWLLSSFMNTVKIGEVFVQLSRIVDPFWNVLRLVAERIDPQVVLVELLLFMLSLVILRAFVGTAQKERCTNVRVCL